MGVVFVKGWDIECSYKDKRTICVCVCVCVTKHIYESGDTIKTKLYRHCVLTAEPGCDDKSAHTGFLGGVCSVRSATRL